jgi:hemolysin III
MNAHCYLRLHLQRPANTCALLSLPPLPKTWTDTRCPDWRGTPFQPREDLLLSHDIVFSQTGPEERANTFSHALGCLLAVVAVPALAHQIDPGARPFSHLGASIFVATMVLMYVVSTVYHALPVGGAKRVFRRVDQAAIFVFIAGSFTPFVLAHVQRGAGVEVMVAVWSLAFAGVTLKLSNRLKSPLLSTGLYLAYGWLMAAMALPMLAALPPVPYSLGCVFYLAGHRVPYSHLIWHLFVVTGSICHFWAVEAISR